jgi:hypothetical protein
VDKNALAGFDLWQTEDLPPPAGLAFSLETAPPAISRWQLDLPDASPAALERLEVLESQQRAAATALAVAPRRLEVLLDQPTLSFSGPSMAEPETDLLGMVAELRGPISFAPGEPSRLYQVGLQFQAGMVRLFQLLSHLAWVETRSEGRLLGQTLVGWSGDTQTLWGDVLEETQQVLHRRNLQLALASRLLHLRLLIIATQAAAKISLLLGGSGGAGTLLALPLAWRYLNQILKELDRYQKVAAG